MTAAAWMDRALCVGADPDTWFEQRHRQEAQRICAQCPVADACRAAWPDAYRGVWGGEVRQPKNPGPSPTAEYLAPGHGSEARYKKHLNDGETPCAVCRLGHTRRWHGYEADQAQKRKTA